MHFTLSATVAALAFLAGSATALPTKQMTYTPAANLDKLAKLMPKSNLPTPDGLQLKYVVLGVGTQNYTCLTDDENAAPGTTGATAALYDIGTYLNNNAFARWTISSISPLALSLAAMPARFTQNLQSLGYEHMVGHHFFAGAAPTFALDQLSSPYPETVLAKLAETDAPASSCPGNDAEGAIKWLYLKDTKGLSRGGIDTVYRIETAGGNKPATCKGREKTFEVKYSAQYWIFGPRT